MLRYKTTIQIETNRNGIHTIKTDTGQTWYTSLVRAKDSSAHRTAWWDMQNKSELRELQKDVFLGEFARLYSRLNWINEMHYYLVYEKGKGYAQPHDIVFARIPTANIWLLGSNDKCWIQHSVYETFTIDIDLHVIEDIKSQESRFQYYKNVLEPIEQHVMQKEEQL